MSITSNMIMALIQIVGEDEFYRELNNINAARARKYCEDKAKDFYQYHITSDERNKLKHIFTSGSRKENENG